MTRPLLTELSRREHYARRLTVAAAATLVPATVAATPAATPEQSPAIAEATPPDVSMREFGAGQIGLTEAVTAVASFLGNLYGQVRNLWDAAKTLSLPIDRTASSPAPTPPSNTAPAFSVSISNVFANLGQHVEIRSSDPRPELGPVAQPAGQGHPTAPAPVLIIEAPPAPPVAQVSPPLTADSAPSIVMAPGGVTWFPLATLFSRSVSTAELAPPSTERPAIEGPPAAKSPPPRKAPLLRDLAATPTLGGVAATPPGAETSASVVMAPAGLGWSLANLFGKTTATTVARLAMGETTLEPTDTSGLGSRAAEVAAVEEPAVPAGPAIARPAAGPAPRIQIVEVAPVKPIVVLPGGWRAPTLADLLAPKRKPAEPVVQAAVPPLSPVAATPPAEPRPDFLETIQKLAAPILQQEEQAPAVESAAEVVSTETMPPAQIAHVAPLPSASFAPVIVAPVIMAPGGWRSMSFDLFSVKRKSAEPVTQTAAAPSEPELPKLGLIEALQQLSAPAAPKKEVAAAPVSEPVPTPVQVVESPPKASESAPAGSFWRRLFTPQPQTAKAAPDKLAETIALVPVAPTVPAAAPLEPTAEPPAAEAEAAPPPSIIAEIVEERTKAQTVAQATAEPAPPPALGGMAAMPTLGGVAATPPGSGVAATPPGPSKSEGGLFGRLFSFATTPESPVPAAESKGVKDVEPATAGTDRRSDGAEIATMPRVNPKELARPQAPDMLIGVLLTMGESVALGKAAPPRPPGTGRNKSCVEKNWNRIMVCIEPVDWPEAMGRRLLTGSVMAQGLSTITRYDDGTATRYHTLFESEAYDTIVAYYTKRFGAPGAQLLRHMKTMGGPGRDNPVVAWRSLNPDTQEVAVLEVRKFDDSRGGFGDTKRGAIMLYTPGSEHIFPQVSTIELMQLRPR